MALPEDLTRDLPMEIARMELLCRTDSGGPTGKALNVIMRNQYLILQILAAMNGIDHEADEALMDKIANPR